jgi:hypothetical protein
MVDHGANELFVVHHADRHTVFRRDGIKPFGRDRSSNHSCPSVQELAVCAFDLAQRIQRRIEGSQGFRSVERGFDASYPEQGRRLYFRVQSFGLLAQGAKPFA